MKSKMLLRLALTRILVPLFLVDNVEVAVGGLIDRLPRI